VWYKMWYKSLALGAEKLLKAIFIRGLSRMYGGRGIRLTIVHESSMQINR
jgi:hypothetical protein